MTIAGQFTTNPDIGNQRQGAESFATDIFDASKPCLAAVLAIPVQDMEIGDEGLGYGEPQTVLPRLGQGAFRVIVTDVYKRQCALTNSHVLHVLDAAHIKPYSLGGGHNPSNGLLLRQDVHTLFDRGYLTVTPDYHVEVSHRLKDEFDNGKEYYALQGKTILLPDAPSFRPSPQQLAWHNENKYLP